MEDLKCPQCSTQVPATGITSAIGVGSGGAISFQPPRQSANCLGCGSRLRRNVEGADTRWKVSMTAEELALRKVDEGTVVGAWVEGPVGPPRDGHALLVAVSDGHRCEHVEVRVSGSQQAIAGDLSRDAIERAVQRRAENLSNECDRLATLVEASPIHLTACELSG